MTKFNVKPLGCDNGHGHFELVGSLDFTEVEVRSPAGLCDEVIRKIYGGPVGPMVAQQRSVVECGEHFLVSFRDNAVGQAFAYVATKEAV